MVCAFLSTIGKTNSQFFILIDQSQNFSLQAKHISEQNKITFSPASKFGTSVEHLILWIVGWHCNLHFAKIHISLEGIQSHAI